MTPQDTPPYFALSTDPMLANIDEVTEDKFELVFIYGHICKVTGDTVRLHQGLDLRQHYEIPRRDIVHAGTITCSEGTLTKLVLFSTTRIAYVSGNATATLPASALAAIVASSNNDVRRPSASKVCPAGCLSNGICRCATIDHWFHLDADTARKMGVVVSNAPAGTQ